MASRASTCRQSVVGPKAKSRSRATQMMSRPYNRVKKEKCCSFSRCHCINWSNFFPSQDSRVLNRCTQPLSRCPLIRSSAWPSSAEQTKSSSVCREKGAGRDCQSSGSHQPRDFSLRGNQELCVFSLTDILVRANSLTLRRHDYQG